MSIGRIAVGHPVDVGSGAVFTKKRDFSVSGTIALDWTRHYETTCIQNAWLGRGWTLPFFMQLEQHEIGFLFTDEIGRQLMFPAASGRLELGERILCYGANMELRATSGRFEILHWHGPTDEVVRFCFQSGKGPRMALTAIENTAGHAILIQYDGKSRPIKVIQGLERRCFELEYDSRDLITAVYFLTDQGQRRKMAQYEYDRSRRLIASADALDSRCAYEYDEEHRLVAERNPLGSTFRFRYDSSNRCVLSSGDDRYIERKLGYLSSPRTTVVTNSLGETTQYLLNPAGQVIQEISPMGAVRTTDYDEYGRILSVSQPDGGRISYEYDERGNCSSLTDESGGKRTFGYNDLHLITTFVDRMGSKWVYEYDALGCLIGIINPLGRRFDCTRDHRSLVTESRRPGGLISKRTYGSQLRSLEITDQISLVLRMEVDELGHQTTLSDAKGLVRQLKYDLLGRPIELIDRLGRATRFRYNATDDLVERIFPDNVWERWDFDRFRRMVAHENAVGCMRFQYDTENRLTKVINRAGEELTRKYDSDGRLVEQVFFDGRIEKYEYSPQGFCTRITKSDGRTVDCEFDKSGSLLARITSDGLEEEFVYDKNGKLVLAKNQSVTVELERNRLGRVVAEISNGRRVDWIFDGDNNRVSRRISGIDRAELVMGYDLRGRLSTVSDSGGVCATFEWDECDKLVARHFRNGMIERFSYDVGQRLLRHEFHSRDTGRVLDRTVEYDLRDNVILRRDLRGRRMEFRYDGINRLLEVREDGGRVESYEYNAVGAVTGTNRGSCVLAAGGRTLFEGRRRYEWGADGCVSRIDGEEGRYQLSHDVHGQVISVTLPGNRSVKYIYDPFGRRVVKEADGKRVEFVWQSCDLAAELEQHGPTMMFLHYNQVPLLQWRERRLQIPVCDRIGLPEMLLDGEGETVWQAHYEAFGRLIREEGASSCPFRFRGQYHDGETGFHYNLHRYYDPSLRGYVAPDPIGLRGGSNFYLYPRNPLLWDDPLGLTCNTMSTALKKEVGESEMDRFYEDNGYALVGRAPGPNGIDGVYHNPDGDPRFIIAEAKFGGSQLGSTLAGQQNSDNWVDSPQRAANPVPGAPSRLDDGVGVGNWAQAVNDSAQNDPGSVQRQVFRLPCPGTPGSGSVVQSSTYNPGSGNRGF
jgi:RHS repeat-associated protein